jgi:hypothetical protein
MGKTITANKLSVKVPDRLKPLERPRHRWSDIILRMILKK